ncbi:MAG TPA: glutamate-1-semialdehyde 2,1-aminomutase [Thermomicrobiales bacterium]|nr:glutamate-1-semialdehyde 2,1-aminomutase [Thermomicrobiales bacterium]
MTEPATRSTSRSAELFERAQQLLPGGVNSPVRAFGAVGGTPRFIQGASGSRVTDADENVYIDYVCSWGPLIAGHANPVVVEAVQQAAARGTSYGAPTEGENELAELIIERFPAIEKVRFVSSGTEAAMSAVRLARAATGRDLIVKFDGCYHGHADSMLVAAGSGVMTFGQPDSPGVPEALAKLTISIPYNDISVVEQVFKENGDKIAAVLIEPVAGNMGVIPPTEGFLEALRQLTRSNGALLIFDEVITGCRVARGGAQERFGIDPDLTILGKIIGGGLPVAAYGGSADLMNQLSPVGNVYQAGTLSGNPLAMAAGIATLKLLDEPGVYAALEESAAYLSAGLGDAAESAGIDVQLQRVGSMMTMFFSDQPATDYQSAKRADTALYARYFHAMLDRGVYFAPSQFECGFVSTAHTRADLDATIEAAHDALKSLAG